MKLIVLGDELCFKPDVPSSADGTDVSMRSLMNISTGGGGGLWVQIDAPTHQQSILGFVVLL